MIKNMVVYGEFGFLATEKQFVFLIEGNIYGPFHNKDWKRIVKTLREEK
ncbi:hypothetical protein [Virgibacillus dokdonensis]|uniref:Uncharacterized protein n=1 Tax=Virgibacillus dokdonensis TaxID=302167 RepID=A0ABU7VIR9_9BACI